MPVVPHLPSIAAIAEQSATGEHFSYALRDFLDGFYADPRADRLAAEPALLAARLNDDGYADAFLAALAEHLATQYRLPAPAWCRDAGRSLARPRFAFETPEGRMFLIVESPTAFRTRNIFITADALTRV